MVIFFRKTKVCSNIKPPAVNIIRVRNPFPADAYDVILKLLRTFVIKLRQGLMPPPAIIIIIIRPVFGIKFKEIPVWTVSRNICPGLIASFLGIQLLLVHPFIERAAVVKNSVKYNLHAPPVHFGNKCCKETVAGLQVSLISYAVPVSYSVSIIYITVCKQFTLIIRDNGKMRIYIIIILNIIFMVRR